MKTLHKTLITLVAGGALAGTTLYANAGNADGPKPDDTGVVVTDVVVIEQMPTEVKGGSIRTETTRDSVGASSAKLSAIDAVRIANTAYPGQALEAELEDENGFLVWSVTQLSKNGKPVTLMIDAGNGRLLAAEADDDEHEDDSGHAGWKFWKDDDHDDERS